jgi:hypothetical protein
MEVNRKLAVAYSQVAATWAGMILFIALLATQPLKTSMAVVAILFIALIATGA